MDLFQLGGHKAIFEFANEMIVVFAHVCATSFEPDKSLSATLQFRTERSWQEEGY